MPARRTPVKPLQRESTAQLIADQLREAIALGQIEPGSQLGEADLAAEFGVSRGPVREGMQRLTQEGLLVSIRNRGLFVIEMTPDNVRDMFVARTAVERAAAARLVHNNPAVAGARLLAVTAKMQRAARGESKHGVSKADIEFHQVLVELADSAHLSRMHLTLLTETRMCIRALEETLPGNDARVAEHRAIAEAIRDGDATRTDTLLIEHTDDAVLRLTGQTPETVRPE